MAATVKPADLGWQDDYAAQLKRTTGYSATFGHHGNGWWTLYADGRPSFGRKRKAEIIQMTANLKKRPDLAPPPEDTTST